MKTQSAVGRSVQRKREAAWKVDSRDHAMRHTDGWVRDGIIGA